MPIAFREGIKSCTQHPISNFISYYRLNPSFKAFTTNLSIMYISKTIKEALIVPRWREVMKEEKRAFDKNDSWELVNNPSEKRPIGCK